MSNWTHQQILDAIPHRDPFLLVDEIVDWTDSRIVCTKVFRGSEDFFAGHYPSYPLVPGRALVRGGHAGRGDPAVPPPGP